jgi:hypothetical protein
MKQPGAGFTILGGRGIGTHKQRFQGCHAVAMNAALGENNGFSSVALLYRVQKQGLPILRSWLAEGAGHG